MLLIKALSYSFLMLLFNTQEGKAQSSVASGVPSEFESFISGEVCSLFNPKFRFNEPLRIGAWNIQRLGKTKIGKPEVVQYILEIMLRYDIIVLQEITDSSEGAPKELLDRLNDYAFDKESNIDPNDALARLPNDTYKLLLSKRVGQSRYKEQYGFYYRTAKVSIKETYQYPDVLDVFQFEPFSIVVESPTTELKSFAVTTIHTSPGDAPSEIDALVDVHDALVDATNVSDVIIIGDFNAGCDFVTSKEWPLIRLANESRFDWLIDNHADTTSKTTSCPYDRIVVSGTSISDSVYRESAEPYYFDSDLNLTNDTLIKAISDHYPVEVLLKPDLQANALAGLGIATDVTIPATSEDIACLNYAIVAQQNSKGASCSLTLEILDFTETFLVANFEENRLNLVMGYLDGLATVNECAFASEVQPLITYKIEQGVLRDPSLHGTGIFHRQLLELSVLCSIPNGYCRFSVRTPTAST